MSTINKETLVAGIIGGVVTAGLLFAGSFLTKRRGCHGGRGRPWKEFPKLEKLDDKSMPQSIAPYSHAQGITYHNGASLVYTAGQLAINPETKALVSNDVYEQTKQILTNLSNLARDNGLEFERDSVKNTVYLIDMKDFDEMNRAYKEYYPN